MMVGVTVMFVIAATGHERITLDENVLVGRWIAAAATDGTSPAETRAFCRRLRASRTVLRYQPVRFPVDRRYPQANPLLTGQGLPAAVASVLARSFGGLREVLFKYKKEECTKPLITLDRKRQLRALNRHDRTEYRQKGLALLSLKCHTSVCLVTELESENDG